MGIYKYNVKSIIHNLKKINNIHENDKNAVKGKYFKIIKL